MLVTRISTALFLLGFLVPTFVWAPFFVVDIIIAIIVGFGAWEWAGLLKKSFSFRKWYVGVPTLSMICLLNANLFFIFIFLSASVCFWLLFAPFALWKSPNFHKKNWEIFLLLSGVVVLSSFGLAAARANQAGQNFFLFTLMLVWLVDTGAFFCGRFIGGAKLAPRISPNKTWAGCLGGYTFVLFLLFFGIIYKVPRTLIVELESLFFLDFSQSRNILKIFALVSLLVCFSVIGDLFESLLKRQAGLKDSGSLLPGHGGVLDRIDSLLPVLPMVMLLFMLLNI